MPDTHSVKYLVISEETALIDWLFDDMGVVQRDGEDAEWSFADRTFRIKTMVGTPTDVDSWHDDVAVSDMITVLIRHVDVVSLDRLRRIFENLPVNTIPSKILVYRQEGETDFKMSCPYCGQKLWVRDADVDKRGRCPNCRKGFTLPSQEDHIGMHLKLGDRVEARKVYQGNPGSISGPLKSLLANVSGERNRAGGGRRPNTTVRVELEGPEDEAG